MKHFYKQLSPILVNLVTLDPGSGILDSGSGIRIFFADPNPDPGGQKHADPGSETLLIAMTTLIVILLIYLCSANQGIA